MMMLCLCSIITTYTLHHTTLTQIKLKIDQDSFYNYTKFILFPMYVSDLGWAANFFVVCYSFTFWLGCQDCFGFYAGTE